jgi:hypothetical protein
VEPLDVAQRIVLESLPALGVLDLGESEAESPEGVALRLTPRGRAMLADKPQERTDGKSDKEAPRSRFLDTHVLQVTSSAVVHTVLGLSTLVEVGRIADTLDLIVAPQTLAKALAAGFEADQVRLRIEEVAPLPETLSRTLAAASVVLGRCTFEPASGFLWVEDKNILELLRTRKATSELFVEPSPPAGLLVQAGVDLDKVVRRCRTIGIEVVYDGNVIRARSASSTATAAQRSLTPPPGKVVATSRTLPRSMSPTPPNVRKSEK